MLIFTRDSIRGLKGRRLRLVSTLESQKLIRHIIILQQDWRPRSHRFVEVCDLYENRVSQRSGPICCTGRRARRGVPSRRPQPATSADTFRPVRPPSV